MEGVDAAGVGRVIDEVIVRPLASLGERVVWLVPKLLHAGLILLIGYVVAAILRRVSTHALRAIGIDVLFRRLTASNELIKEGITRGPSDLGGFIVYWSIMLSAVLYGLQILGLSEAAILLERLIGFVPVALASLGIMTIGLYAADLFGRIVTVTAASAQLPLPRWWGLGVQYATVGFTFLAVLDYLQIATSSLLLVVGIVVSIVPVAAMIAFGLGGRRQAAELISGKALRNELQVGDTLRFRHDGQVVEGVVEVLGHTLLRLRSEDGVHLVPYSTLTDRVVAVRPQASSRKDSGEHTDGNTEEDTEAGSGASSPVQGEAESASH